MGWFDWASIEVRLVFDSRIEHQATYMLHDYKEI